MAKGILVFVLVTILTAHCCLGQSLSRLKTVSMSSQNSDWVGSLAVDGNYDRNSSTCGCCAGTSFHENMVDPWIEIDLGDTTEFNRIVVYGQTSVIRSRQNLIGLTIRLDGAETSIASIKDTQGYVNFYHFDFGRKYSARRIKFILKGSDKVLVLCETDIFNDSIISNGKDVIVKPVFPIWSSNYSVDGNIRTDADVCLCCAATDYHTDPWLYIDLGDEFLITCIQLHGRTDTQPDGQSFDGMTITLDDVAIETVPRKGEFVSYYEIFPSPEKFGRNIKFTLVGEKRKIVMCEVVIHGVRVISTRKEAKASSLFYDWAASRSVDGDYRTDPVKSPCCTATLIEDNPWLRVDLGQEYIISRIVIYGRTDNQYASQSFVGMNISFDASVVHTIPASSNATNFYTYSLPSTQLARNVTVTLVGTDKQLVVCELVIYGECPHGTIGLNCQDACDMCDCGEVCDKTTGKCPDKCPNGDPQDEGSESNTSTSVAVYIVPTIIVIIILLIVLFCCWRRSKARSSNDKAKRKEDCSLTEAESICNPA